MFEVRASCFNPVVFELGIEDNSEKKDTDKTRKLLKEGWEPFAITMSNRLIDPEHVMWLKKWVG